jgi:AcrR family transcriptional regulator
VGLTSGTILRHDHEGAAVDRDTDTTPGLRERKKLATREAVRAAAVRLAVRDGIEDVTVERIAQEADVSLRTFFNHFPHKEDAVLDAVRVRAAELITEFRRRPTPEPVPAAVREAALAVIDRDDVLGRDHLAALRLVRRAPSLLARQMTVLHEQEDALAAAIADRLGVDRSGAAGSSVPDVLAAMTLAALRVALDRWLAQDAGDGTAAAERAAALRQQIDTALELLTLTQE